MNECTRTKDILMNLQRLVESSKVFARVLGMVLLVTSMMEDAMRNEEVEVVLELIWQVLLIHFEGGKSMV